MKRRTALILGFFSLQLLTGLNIPADARGGGGHGGGHNSGGGSFGGARGFTAPPAAEARLGARVALRRRQRRKWQPVCIIPDDGLGAAAAAEEVATVATTTINRALMVQLQTEHSKALISVDLTTLLLRPMVILSRTTRGHHSPIVAFQSDKDCATAGVRDIGIFNIDGPMPRRLSRRQISKDSV